MNLSNIPLNQEPPNIVGDGGFEKSGFQESGFGGCS